MTNQGNTTTRPPAWEDEAPSEPRYRRVRQGVSRPLPGLPLQFEDPEDESEPRLRRRRFEDERDEALKGRWWRPASTAGRIFLALGALTVLGSLTAAGLALRTFLERDARFRITGTSDIQAVGLTEVSRADMLPVFGEDIGRNIFFVPLDQRRKELEQLPWIEQATVMRLLPDQIRVSVVERQPVAFTRIGNQIGLVDANGVLLSMPAATMAQRHYSFPVVTGIDPADPLATRKARMAVYLRLMADLDSTGQHYSQQISEIDLTDPEDARVLMPEQGADILAHFGQDHFLERYLRYKAHIAEWRQQYPHLSAVDLRYDQQVVLEMASGSETAQGDAGPAKPQAGEPAATEPSTAKPGTAQKKATRPSAKNAKKTKSAAARMKTAKQKKRAETRRAEERRAVLAEIRRREAELKHSGAERGE